MTASNEAPAGGKAGEGEGKPKYAAALAGVTEQRQKLIAKDHLKLLVPGYKGNLRVNYRLLSDTEADELAERVERAEERKDAEGIRQGAADILVRYCDKIEVREPGEKDWMVLEQGNGPVRFGRELAELMPLGGDTATEILLDVFSPKGEDGNRRHPEAIISHMEAIGDWRQGREEAIDRTLLGE